ncbi:MAG: alcohol dehydrogenase catalytic domain-containing protein [Clostridiales bacterium]|nr:alcohol dehydrogenase catalytic domain-containing protein [Clostridiales bacterium]
MKALYYDKGLSYVEDYKLPELGPNESLIKVLISSICNTDKEVLRGYRPDFKGILGHEFVGEVVESNNKNLIGKRVVGEINENCGKCLYCITGRPTHCENRKVVGMNNHDGAFAEYMKMRTDLLHLVPEEVPTELAVFTEPLAAALEILDQVHIKPSTSVAILGDGRLSYMIAQVVSLTGADLTVIGRHEDKLKSFAPFAKTTAKTYETFEVVIDATGSPTGLIDAQKIVRKKGIIVIKSTYAGTIDINMSDFVVNEISLIGSRCGPFEPALQLLRRGLINFPEIDLYDLKDYEKAFNSRAFKAGFRVTY